MLVVIDVLERRAALLQLVDRAAKVLLRLVLALAEALFELADASRLRIRRLEHIVRILDRLRRLVHLRRLVRVADHFRAWVPLLSVSLRTTRSGQL